MTPTKHASRSRVRRPRAGTRRGVLSTITPPVVSSPEPVAAVVNRPKSTSIGSSIQHHARGIQSRNPKFPGRSFTSIDIHPSAHAVETDTKKSKRNGNPRAGPSPSSRRRRRRYAPSSQTASLGMPCSASARARVRARVDAIFSQLKFLPLILLEILLYEIVYRFRFLTNTRVRLTQLFHN